MEGAPPDGFLIDGHMLATFWRMPAKGAPPDGFLIDGHEGGGAGGATALGAPPDGFLIDGHSKAHGPDRFCVRAVR